MVIYTIGNTLWRFSKFLLIEYGQKSRPLIVSRIFIQGYSAIIVWMILGPCLELCVLRWRATYNHHGPVLWLNVWQMIAYSGNWVRGSLRYRFMYFVFWGASRFAVSATFTYHYVDSSGAPVTQKDLSVFAFTWDWYSDEEQNRVESYSTSVQFRRPTNIVQYNRLLACYFADRADMRGDSRYRMCRKWTKLYSLIWTPSKDLP